MMVERVAGRSKETSSGSFDRQIGVGHRHRAAIGAMDHRDRAAPIALARNTPVAQAEIDLARGDCGALPRVSASPEGDDCSFASGMVSRPGSAN
jgi:hypothetical protein